MCICEEEAYLSLNFTMNIEILMILIPPASAIFKVLIVSFCLLCFDLFSFFKL